VAGHTRLIMGVTSILSIIVPCISLIFILKVMLIHLPWEASYEDRVKSARNVLVKNTVGGSTIEHLLSKCFLSLIFMK